MKFTGIIQSNYLPNRRGLNRSKSSIICVRRLLTTHSQTSSLVFCVYAKMRCTWRHTMTLDTKLRLVLLVWPLTSTGRSNAFTLPLTTIGPDVYPRPYNKPTPRRKNTVKFINAMQKSIMSNISFLISS